jgi:hypothetical protein
MLRAHRPRERLPFPPGGRQAAASRAGGSVPADPGNLLVDTRTSRLGAAELVWDAETRRGTLRFVDPAGHAGGAEAAQLTTDLAAWLGADGDEDAPFSLLVDCTEIGSIDAAWRQLWADFFLAHRDHAHLAWFNATPQIALIVTMFRKGTGVRGEAFDQEADARAYLDAVT